VADWDEDSPRLRENLNNVLSKIRDDAERRVKLTLESARQWQRGTMDGLEVPSPGHVGKYRGEVGVKRIRVWIGTAEGVDPRQVAIQLKAFEKRLQRTLVALDKLYPHGKELDADGLSAVIDLAAWVHSEWVRIHPFAAPRPLRNCSARTNLDLFHFPVGNFLTPSIIIVSSASANRLRANTMAGG
jgi:hypothetical protein